VPLSIKQVAMALGIDEEELERRALRALLMDELRRVRAEKASILIKYKKHGVKTFKDLLNLVEKDVISDVDAHDDLIRLDYLEHREEELEKLLKELGQ